MIVIHDKRVVWCYNFIAGHIYVFIAVWNLIWSLNLWSQHKKIFHTSEFSGWSGSKLVHFGLMLNCFGPVRSGENIIGSVRGRGHKIYYFSVRSESGQKITGQFGVGVPKTLPRRTLMGTSLGWEGNKLIVQRTGDPLTATLGLYWVVWPNG